MRTNYILIDYENVQPANLSLLSGEHYRVMVFVGAHQAKVTFEVAMALQNMGTRASYIKTAGQGSNALDFLIAFYVGKLAACEPEAHFHIVSKDTGFDSLVEHLKSQNIRVCRAADLLDIPLHESARSHNTG